MLVTRGEWYTHDITMINILWASHEYIIQMIPEKKKTKTPFPMDQDVGSSRNWVVPQLGMVLSFLGL